MKTPHFNSWGVFHFFVEVTCKPEKTKNLF